MLAYRRLLGGLLGASLVVSGACQAPPEASLGEGPVARTLELAADEAGVPRALLLAVAVEENGLRLAPRRLFDAADHVPVAGHLELRHGALDTLRRGAELVGVSEEVLVEDTALATRAGAAVLAELGGLHGARNDDLASWMPALEELSGLGDGAQRREYARRVLGHLRDGGEFRAYAGERVRLPAHVGLSLPGVAVQAVGGTPEFPGAIWFNTSCTNKCNVGRGGKTIDTILIHDTEGGWNASVATLQYDSGKSVHYIIDADGSRVGQFRPEADITWHCGNSVYNGRSIGIEHVGFASDPDGYDAALYDKSVALVKSIRTRHNIPLDRQHVIGHYQVPDGGQISSSSAPCTEPLMSCLGSSKYGGASNHRDPGPKWMWCQYMQKLGGTCSCADASAIFNCTTDKTQAFRCVGGAVEIRDCDQPCVVQPSGVDDLCTATTTTVTPGQPGPRNPRSERVEPALREAPVSQPADQPAIEPEVEAGCAMARPAERPPGTAIALVLLAAWLASRRHARRAAP